MGNHALVIVCDPVIMELANSPARVYWGYTPTKARKRNMNIPKIPVVAGFTIVIDFERERVWSYILRSAKIKPDLKK